MSLNFSVNQRLPCYFNNFVQQENKFCDVILDFPTHSPIKTHRVLLAKESEWFHNYFAAHPLKQGENCMTVACPVNSGEIFPEIIKFLYENEIQITLEKIPPLYHCAHFYKFRKLLTITRMHLQRAINKQTAIYLCSNLVKYHMDEAASLVSTIFAEEMQNILENKQSLYTKSEIFKACSPYVLSAVLKDFQLDFLTPEQKVELIDEFVGDSEIENEADKEALASVIDWNEDNAYMILIANKCEWMPARISRGLYSKALDARRSVITRFNSRVDGANDYLGRWFPLSWLRTISLAEECEEPHVDAVEFMSTFGISKKRSDPRKYALVEIECSKPISEDFHPSTLLTCENYFVSRTGENELPYIEIDFGIHAGIVTQDLDISCEASNSFGMPKAIPNKLTISGYVQGSDTPIYERTFSYGKAKMTDNFRTAPLECQVPIRKLKISLTEDSGNGFNILRLTGLHVNCYFDPV